MWVQDGQAIKSFNKFGDGCDIIWLVDVISVMSLNKDSEKYCLSDKKLLIVVQDIIRSR